MYYSDNPINTNSDDQLGRKGFAELLAHTLINLNNQDTFSVGLFGKWGSGKSSIVNMTLQKIEEQQKGLLMQDKLMIVHFEPWNFSNTDQLLTQFFIRLSNEFRSTGDKRLEKIGKALERYSDAFDLLSTVPYIGGLLGFVGKKGAAAAGSKLKKGSDEKDIFKQKETVVKLLKEHSSKILVVIDDIDRLSNKQIRQVFQLVTSVAKFPNTIYLLIFDKDIVVKALEKVQEGRGEDYLEKIIQMPIQIPDINSAKLRQVLLDRLDEILLKHEGIGFQKEHWEMLYRSCVMPFIDSLRMANRLCNTVQFKITSIYTEIDFSDMVAISLLEITFPEVYEWVKANKSILTGSDELSSIGNQNKTPKDRKDFYSAKIHELLEHTNGSHVNDSQVEKIIEFLSYLFPYFGRKIGEINEVYTRDSLRRNNQIAHPDKFDRYFAFDLDEIPIRKAAVEEAAFKYDSETLVSFLVEQGKNGTSYEFLEEIRAIAVQLPSDRAKIIIVSLLTVSVELQMRSQKGFLSLSAGSLVEQIAIYLLERIDASERFEFLSDIIWNGDLTILQSVADVINKIELAHGRLAANGLKQDEKKLISLQELEQIERIFTEKAKQVLAETNLFDMNRWENVFYLLEWFDPDYAKTYLASKLEDDENIVKYMSEFIVTLADRGISYVVQASYPKYLTDERVLQAIEALKQSGEFFTMPEEIQRKCASFYLYTTSKERDDPEISQNAADKLLSSWKIR